MKLVQKTLPVIKLVLVNPYKKKLIVTKLVHEVVEQMSPHDNYNYTSWFIPLSEQGPVYERHTGITMVHHYKNDTPTDVLHHTTDNEAMVPSYMYKPYFRIEIGNKTINPHKQWHEIVRDIINLGVKKDKVHKRAADRLLAALQKVRKVGPYMKKYTNEKVLNMSLYKIISKTHKLMKEKKAKR